METQALRQESPEWMSSLSTHPIQSGQDNTDKRAVKDNEITKNSGNRLSVSSVPEKTELNTDRVTLSAQAQSLGGKPVTQLNDVELDLLSRLKARDTEVRTHEAAHLANAGQYATSGAGYTFQEGPNGKQYAIGGEVGIDVSPVADDPEATISKADTIMQAALSPASPSPQDFKVADQARQMRIQAVRELAIKEAQDQQQTRQEEAKTAENQAQQNLSQQSQSANVEAQKAEDNKAAMRTEAQKAEDQKAEQQKMDSQNAADANNQTLQQDSAQKSDESAKRMSDNLASLNELFARYDEARQTYQAIIDFFTNQYERSKSNTPLKIELFA